jgi:hypothetical protein
MAGAATVGEETSQRGLPTTTGFAAREAIAMLRKHNIATAPLLLRAGLSEHGLARAADEGNGLPLRVSAIGQCKFFECAAEAMNDSPFGLHLARQIDPRDVGMYFYAGSAARDPGEALALFSRYCRIVNEAFSMALSGFPCAPNAAISLIASCSAATGTSSPPSPWRKPNGLIPPNTGLAPSDYLHLPDAFADTPLCPSR